MKRNLMIAAAMFAATMAYAAENQGVALDEKTEKLVRMSLPVCSDMKLTPSELPARLPAGMTGTVVRIDSPRPTCAGQYVAITTSGGSFYFGAPWFLEDAQGATLEEKIKNFTWTRLQENFEVTVEKQRNREGLFPVHLYQMAERGRIPIDAAVDPDGRVLFIGRWSSASVDPVTTRIKAFESFAATAPTRGSSKPRVTVVEFSDFQCPSCKHASHYLDTIMDKHGQQVRYTRMDLPLVNMHPWALSAAIAGHAVNAQKPELFWDYKKTIYGNQEKLTAFTIDDFTRNFAQDHDLNMEKYDRDVNSTELRADILKGVGAAFSYDVRATPTYMVNGIFVDPGDDGKALEMYIANLLK